MNLGGPFIYLMLSEWTRDPGPVSRQGHDLVALILLEAGQPGAA
jgi:hypothetical protein